MIVDNFRKFSFWESLEKYNKDIANIYRSVTPNDDTTHSSFTTWWFHPDKVKELELRIRGSRTLWRLRENDEMYTLTLGPNNYLTLFLLPILYENKNILIEDVGCGMGRLIYYLSKVGFNNFSLIENFSQVERKLLEKTMTVGKINYVLNDENSAPIVTTTNLPWYFHELPNSPKKSTPIESCELFCFYSARSMFTTIVPYLLNNGYVELCEDWDRLSVAYCKKEKYEEFKSKLIPYLVEEVACE